MTYVAWFLAIGLLVITLFTCFMIFVEHTEWRGYARESFRWQLYPRWDWQPWRLVSSGPSDDLTVTDYSCGWLIFQCRWYTVR